jgi:anti-anti-sigma factor
VHHDLAFGIEADPKGSRSFVLSGELDMASAPTLLATVEPVLQVPVGDLVLDARGLSFVDSTGISALIQIATRLEEGQLTLVAPAPNVARVLKLVRAEAFPNVRIVWEE